MPAAMRLPWAPIALSLDDLKGLVLLLCMAACPAVKDSHLALLQQPDADAPQAVGKYVTCAHIKFASIRPNDKGGLRARGSDRAGQCAKRM